jgi:hypothetical protein
MELQPNGAVARRRGRPCAVERLRNEIMQQKLAQMINSNQVPSNEFAKLNILPIIVKRQRRVRANDRERNRMQSLNGALRVLRQHLPIEMLMENTLNLECNRDKRDSGAEKASTKTNGGKKKAARDSKVTKIDTLRMATRYIAMLGDLLRDSDAESSSTDLSNSTLTTCTAHSKTNSSASVNSYESDSQQSPTVFASSSSYLPEYMNCSTDINANYHNSVNSNYSVKNEPMEMGDVSHQRAYFSNQLDEYHHVYTNGGLLSSNDSIYNYPSAPNMLSQQFCNQYNSSSSGYSQFVRSNCIKYF